MGAQVSKRPRMGWRRRTATTSTPSQQQEPVAGTSLAPVPVSFRQLFRFADRADRIMYAIAVAAGITNGCLLPAFAYLLGSTFNSLGASQADLVDKLQKFALYFFILGFATFFLTLFEQGFAAISSERQVMRLRMAYLRALLRQDIAYHDMASTGEVAARLAEDTILVQAGIGERATEVVRYVSTFIAGLVLGLILSWKLALVILALVPLIVGAGTMLRVCTLRFERRAQDAYARAGDAANEALQAFRVVTAFNGQQRECARYDSHLVAAERAGIRKGLFTGLAVGILFATIFISYAVGLRYGAELIIDSRNAQPICRVNPVADGCFSGGNVISVFFAVLIGSMSLGQIAPNVAQMARAQAAAARMYDVIARKPPIDMQDAEGVQLQQQASGQVRGLVEFRDVCFAYPTRPDRPIFQNLNLVWRPGERLGVCGPSGSGKSTLIALLQRWYDPQSGEILLDGVPLPQYNVVSLRSAMGLVPQNPDLLSASIQDNIAAGKPREANITDHDVRAAARAAQAHSFITQLPDGYNTQVGERGTQLSGGQRQRIAIARALIRQPQLLLLDEATSALSSVDEAAVQRTLQHVMREGSGAGRGSLVIAHRLSTIANADRIILLAEGRVVEEGTHASLISQTGGMYAQLWQLQQVHGLTTAVDQQEQERAEAEAEEGARRDAAPPDTEAASPVSPQLLSPPHHRSGSSQLSVTESADFAAAAAVGAAAVAGGGSTGVPRPVAPPPAGMSTVAPEREGVWMLLRGSRHKLPRKRGYDQPPVPFARVFEYQRPDLTILLGALAVAAANGVIFPAFSIIYSNMIIVYFNPVDSEVRSKSTFYMGLLFGLAAVAFLLNALQTYGFTLLGERLTRRLRSATYAAVLRQPMAFFDDPAHSVGKLTSRLASDAALVKATVGERVGLLLMTAAGMIAGFVIAFVATWRLALVLLVFSPFLVFGAFMQTRLQHRGSEAKDIAMAEAGSIAVEALSAIRTVTAFNLQPLVLSRFEAALALPLQVAYTQARVGGGLTALGQGLMFAVYAAAFYFGSLFIQDGTLNFQNLTKAYFAVVLASRGSGMASGQAADVSKAEAAKRNTFAILDRRSEIDPTQPGGRLLQPDVGHTISFRGTSFAYPSRPNVTVLKSLDFVIRPGERLGLCGPSGCGKSTLIALLLRLYDPQSGEILLDGVPLKDYNVVSLRSIIGLVAQEPQLFSMSLADNIAYGRAPGSALTQPSAVPIVTVTEKPGMWENGAGNAGDAGEEGESKADIGATATATTAAAAAATPVLKQEDVAADVLTASADAHCHGFITQLPQGYATPAGAFGAQLSGGQRQRIAIARALIRQPQLLLLDEATSALSSVDEAAVQRTLQRVMAEAAGAGRSSLAIAHRLATIAQSDRILVLSAGRKVQEGTNDELLRDQQGLYAALVAAQQAGSVS